MLKRALGLTVLLTIISLPVSAFEGRGKSYENYIESSKLKPEAHVSGLITTKIPTNWSAESRGNRSMKMLLAGPNVFDSIVRSDIPFYHIIIQKNSPVSFDSFVKGCKKPHPSNKTERGPKIVKAYEGCSKQSNKWGIITVTQPIESTNGVTYYFGIIYQDHISKLPRIQQIIDRSGVSTGW